MSRPKKVTASEPKQKCLVPLAVAAARLSVSPDTLRRMMRQQTLRLVRLGRGRGVLRVPESEIARLLAARAVPVVVD